MWAPPVAECDMLQQFEGLLVVSISFISYPSLKDGSVSYSPSSPLQFKQVVT